MRALLKLSEFIDRLLAFVAKIGAWAGMLLVLVVCYDVGSRYFGLPKPFGLNSTMVQESEYWLHTILFTLVIGYAYTKQAHVRIDLVRERLPLKARYVIEIVGIVFFLLTYVAVAVYYTAHYAYASYLENEVSSSTIGLSNLWILKSFLPTMFVLVGLAGISQLIKSVAGLLGVLPPEKIAETLGGDL